jgi:hypothetical protein
VLPATVQFFIAMIACSLNERMHKKLDFVQEEVRALKELLASATGTHRIRFTDDQRRRLAIKGKDLSPRERRECCQVVMPETILAWFRRLVARKYDSSHSRKRQPGRPRKAVEIRRLVVEIALANVSWGYTKIRDALRTGLKIEIGRTTVANILAEAGLEPAPEREKKRTWKQFMRSHWDSLYACDFFAVEALGVLGPVRFMVFFVIELRTRAVEIAGIRIDPNGEWMKQMGRNLTDPVDGFLRNASYLIHDRDPLFTEAFRHLLASGGVKTAKIPAMSPNCNPHSERFVKSIKHECLNRFVFFGERHVRHVINEYMAHYLRERFHQGLGGQLIKAARSSANDNEPQGAIGCRSRLGGLLNYYRREAA